METYDLLWSVFLVVFVIFVCWAVIAIVRYCKELRREVHELNIKLDQQLQDG